MDGRSGSRPASGRRPRLLGCPVSAFKDPPCGTSRDPSAAPPRAAPWHESDRARGKAWLGCRDALQALRYRHRSPRHDPGQPRSDQQTGGSPCLTLHSPESAAAAALRPVSPLGSPRTAGISRCPPVTPTTNVSATVRNRTILNDSLTNSAAKIGGSCWCPATSKIPPYQPRW